jgi:L-aspartate oxidase
MDMEFIQFHPTALRLPGVPTFLISEAVRGEGALLLDIHGRRFMPAYDARAELAPRDIVARAIVAEMVKTGADHVLLDVSHLAPERTLARFPSIAAYCRQHGIDITRQPVPVSPAAHYMMGGVRTNSWGETTIRNLYACGETACTGVHGANRLASNSLLETVVFAKRIIERTLSASRGPLVLSPGARRLSQEPAPGAGEETTSELSLPSLQELMWEKAGIVRDGSGLGEACAALSSWQLGQPEAPDRPATELRNLVLAGRLVAEAALQREESRGAHYRSDFPRSSEAWRRHLVFRKEA